MVRRVETAGDRADAVRVRREMEGSIEAMSANGLSPQQIALLTKIAPQRLYARYKDAMMRGGARRTHEVAEVGYQMAIGGKDFASSDFRKADAGMAKFWLERMGGPMWAPPRDDDQGPDLSKLTVQQLIELEKALRPTVSAPVMIDGVRAREEDKGGVSEAGAGG